MTSQRRIDLEELHNALIRARRRGVRAPRLLDYAPDLIEMLYPAEQHPNLDDDERAQATENLIKAAVDSIGGDVGHALALTLCLPPGTIGLTLEQRRQRAAEHLRIDPHTWERGWREPRLIRDLVYEINQLHRTNPTAYLPASDLTHGDEPDIGGFAPRAG